MKKIILIVIGSGLFCFLLSYIYYININNYHINVFNNTKMINTSLFAKVIDISQDSEQQLKENNDEEIEKDKKIDQGKEEVITPDNKVIVSEVQQNTNSNVISDNNSEIVSSIIEDNTKDVQEKQLDEVYVGLVFSGSMTAYGSDCCGNNPGITATGFDLKQSLVYNDPTYGSVRIVASDRNFKYYSIIKVNDPIEGEYKVIVLDRAGSVIGLNKTKKFDLAVESESFAVTNYGVHNNVVFEVLRVGK